MWDLKQDCFTFGLQFEDKPLTRRGVLSTLNSIFDPLGFISPITTTGKILLRQITQAGLDWDTDLPPMFLSQWELWRLSVQGLRTIVIPRTYSATSFSSVGSPKVYVFSDASEDAIAAVAYIKLDQELGFVLGRSKLAPTSGHSIPRLELCAAVLATDVAVTVSRELDVPFSNITYFTDSKIVLGYIYNQTRRFHTYVSNRVGKILNVSTSEQWHHVATDINPADIATRKCSAVLWDMSASTWIHGPKFLLEKEPTCPPDEVFDLVNPEGDREVRPVVTVLKSTVDSVEFTDMTKRFEKFSTFSSLISAISFLKSRCSKNREDDSSRVERLQDSENYVFRQVQNKMFEREIDSLSKGHCVSKSSSIAKLKPFLDERGVLRVGGRISRAQLPSNVKQPILIPKKSHIATLLIRHFHEKTHHQGRLMTESSLRMNGFWIVGMKRLINNILHHCVMCRRLRGKFVTQQMSDLPEERITPSPPFTIIGVDTFGPWNVVTRRTRGGAAENKRWAIIFTCFSTRAVHIELVEDLSSSSIINAMRRFVALRGPEKEVWSDRGTNFVGAVDDLKAETICVEDEVVKKFLDNSKVKWCFNPPHASHMGGVWERLIGVARRILDAMLLESHTQRLTHEVLITFMYEVSAIINSRPIAPISTDPEDLEVISPATLLTQKVEPLESLDPELSTRDIYKSQWKYVQVLSQTFWKQWKNGYLQTLQYSRKWLREEPSLKEGDLVLVKDVEVHRNHWPLGVVSRVFPGSDKRIRSAEVTIAKGGKRNCYVRPITELVLLIE